MKTKRNNLVYLPANVKLYQFTEDIDLMWSVSRFHELEKPMNVLLLKDEKDKRGTRSLNGYSGERYLQILYNAEKWFVKDTDVYELRS